MITILLNGERRELEEGTTLRELIAALALRDEHVAVELNRAIVPRARRDETRIAAGDEVELVTLVGGG